MLDASLIVLPEVEQALMSAMHDIKRFCLDLQNDDNTPKRLNKSLLYKAHHHIQLCENNLHGSGILLPVQYLHSILNCLEVLQENSDIEIEKFSYILNAVQSLLEYINHSLSIGIQDKNQQKYVHYLYYPYNKLLNSFGIDSILTIEEFLNCNGICEKFDIDTAYYAKYDIFSLKQLKEYIINIKDNWHDVNATLEYARRSIDIILNIEWDEILPLMQCIDEYLKNNQKNADLEAASALLFLEYIINEPWRVHEIFHSTNYSLKQIIQTLVEQIYSPNLESVININEIHQRVQAYSIRKSVLYQIDILIKEAQNYAHTDFNKSSEIIQQIGNILQTIGFKDKSNLLCKLQQKLASLNKSKITEQDINYINYIFGSLSQYVQNNYPEDNTEDFNNDTDEFSDLFENDLFQGNYLDSYNLDETNNSLFSQNDILNENDEDKYDSELLEIFKQEQADLLSQIKKHRDNLICLPKSPSMMSIEAGSKEAVLSLRRCFHTFKSSFKILDLNNQSKSSSYIEQIFNKYISQKDIDEQVLFKLIELSLIAFSSLENQSSQELEEINIICELLLMKEFPKLNLNNLTQNQLEESADLNQDDKSIFKQNLLFIYIHEVEQVLHSLEQPLQQKNAKEFLKILHKVEGSSSTANCVSIREWCKYIRQAVEKYRNSPKIPEVVATLVQYAIYIAIDIPKTLNIENAGNPLSSENQAFLEQIVQKATEDAAEQEISAPKNEPQQYEEEELFFNSYSKVSSNLVNNNVNKYEQAENTQIIDNLGVINLNTADIELVCLFIEEAQTLHANINQNIDNLYLDNNASKEILRALHTLKGGARMVGIDSLGEQYHILEDDVAQNVSINRIQQKLLELSQQLDYIAQQAMLNQSNVITSNFTNNSYSQSEEVSQGISEKNLNISDTINDSFVVEKSKPPSLNKNEKYDNTQKSWYIKVEHKKLGEFIEKSYHVEGYISKINIKIKDLISQVQNTFMPLQQMNQLISQITLQEHKKIESLANYRNTDNIQNTMDSLEFDIFSNLQIQLSQSQNVNNSIIAQQEYVLECLSNISDLINSLLKYHSTDIQHELIHLSLLSFNQITPKLYQVCQQVAKEQKKKVKLYISGESIRVSKAILEGVSFAFEHLIRNAVKHGIESPETRKQNNKPEEGKININIQQQGEYMHINFRDDGQGIDTKGVRQRAIQKNWLSEDDEVSMDQLISFILEPGFSTAQDLSQTAGRGIGLDTVVAYIKEIGGEVSVATHINTGFSISMIFPLQSFVSDILVCKVGEYSFGTLLNNINKINLYPSQPDLEQGRGKNYGSKQSRESENNNFNSSTDMDSTADKTAHNKYNTNLDSQPEIKYNEHDDKKNYISMLDLLGKKEEKENIKEHKKYIVLNIHNESYNLGLDEAFLYKSMYIRKASIPYKNEGLVGISIINFTDILPIYNLEMLLKSYHNNYAYETDIDTLDYINHTAASLKADKFAFAAGDASVKKSDKEENNNYNDVNDIINNTSYENNNRHIMVVDDSSTLRFTTQRILKKYNYEVTLAIDGIEALEKIEAIEKIEDMHNNHKNIDLFLVDIEMPRMDGFELIAAIRSNPLHFTTPIIVISSRQIEKYQQQAYDLGANDFLGKPYQTAQLMSHITRELTKANINRKYS